MRSHQLRHRRAGGAGRYSRCSIAERRVRQYSRNNATTRQQLDRSNSATVWRYYYSRPEVAADTLIQPTIVVFPCTIKSEFRLASVVLITWTIRVLRAYPRVTAV
jgi:hypothetical protein